jgi:signal transduction histidine kinase
VGFIILHTHHGTARRQDFLCRASKQAEARAVLAAARADGEAQTTAWVCHEIRNPLNALMFCIEEIKEHAAVTTHVKTMQLCSKHILSVITNMLDLFKLTEGKMPLKRAVFDLGECTQSIDMMCRPLLKSGVAMRLDIRPCSPITMDGDAVLLKQLLVNLVCNAAQAVQEGFIEVLFTRAGADLVIAVRDTGPGLSPLQIEDLFQKYKQMTPERSGGSGLGLVLAQQIAKAFGTEITVESPWQGSGQAGTSMRVILPDCFAKDGEYVAVDPVVHIRVDDSVVSALEHILIVEDEPMNQMVGTFRDLAHVS